MRRVARWSVTREPAPRAEGALHRLMLALVWVAVASSAVVFTEPAPVDALMMGLIVLLPVVGLVAIRQDLLVYLALWLVCAAAAFLAVWTAGETGRASVHTGVSVYLYVTSFVLAAFIARRPERHLRLVLNAYLWAAVIASIAAVCGYFRLIPGAYELFTLHGRARGTFKDPNVFASFLIPAIIYALHRWLEHAVRRAYLALILLPLLGLALLVSFSRGAWMCLAVAFSIYAYLAFVTAETDRVRANLLVLVAVSFAVAGGLLAVATQLDDVSRLFGERASLDQSYDSGPEGRFGGQWKAIELIIANPLGIGGREFGGRYHAEDPHNVYLSMMLNAGWIGGTVYVLIVLLAIAGGLRHAFRRSPVRGLHLVALSSLIGLVLLGFVIDTDHWRHFYLVLALVWGVMAGNQPRLRDVRIVRLAGMPQWPLDWQGPRRAARLGPPIRRPSAVILPFRQPRRRKPRRPARIVGLSR